MNKGITLFVTLVTVGTLMVIIAGLVNLALRQKIIASAGEASQHAFYAADVGLECAFYWDVQNPSGRSAFATSSVTAISCNGINNNVGSVSTSTFTITFLPDPYCAEVSVGKHYVGSAPLTIIESKGYNTCGSSARRVERAIRATY